VFRRQLFKTNFGVPGMGHADGIARFPEDIGYSGIRSGNTTVHGRYDLQIILEIGYQDAGIKRHAGVGNV
jgi:hypothetical protein